MIPIPFPSPFRTVHVGLLFCLSTALADPVYPREDWPIAESHHLDFVKNHLEKAQNYALTGGGSGLVLFQGRRLSSWGDLKQKYDLKSSSKSIGFTAMGLALMDNKLTLEDKASAFHPEFGIPPETNKDNGWLDQITLFQLATQTAGFAKPGGYEPLLFKPGTHWHYSDGGPNWIADCLTLIYQTDLETLLMDRVFRPIGITSEDLHWRRHAYRPRMLNDVPRREFGSGVHADVDAMARIGYLYLRKGLWNGKRLLPESFTEQVSVTPQRLKGLPEFEPTSSHGNASDHYGLLWWNNSDGTLNKVPHDAFWSWGLYDSLIVVVPSLDLVISRAGRSWNREGWNAHYDVLKPFLEPLVKAAALLHAGTEDQRHLAPVPPSPVVAKVEWQSAESIQRKANGSDNWPITWTNDGSMFTAYGDGWGFEPRTEKKLSLGLSKIDGPANQFQGVNIRSDSGERLGQGAAGEKASGLLSVDGVLYMWIRNAKNSQLSWSENQGRDWRVCDWKWTEIFGAPTFVNISQDHQGVKDPYVYVVSHDSDSAYVASDGMILARVPKDFIRNQAAYEFYAGTDASELPMWSRSLADRQWVFEHAGQCYRSGMSYNAALQRFFWCQVHPQSLDDRGPRFQGGLGIYDAPQPWGPWTTVYYREHWDVGPGETASFPVKWIAGDGQTMHMVFSGDDHFSVRACRLHLNDI